MSSIQRSRLETRLQELEEGFRELLAEIRAVLMTEREQFDEELAKQAGRLDEAREMLAAERKRKEFWVKGA